MTRTTALAALLMLAALPAAAQSETEASLPSAGAGAPPIWAGRVANEDPAVFYSGPMIGLPSLTDTRPSSAGDLPAPGFFVITEPTVVLNHLDFGAYEPYEPRRSRAALESSRGQVISPTAHNGIDDVAVDIIGTPGQTKLGTSYSTTTGPIDWHAKAGIAAPGLPEVGKAVEDPLHSPDVKVGMKYKF